VNIGYAWGWNTPRIAQGPDGVGPLLVGSAPGQSSPPFVPHDLNYVGSYRHRFEVPASWHGRPRAGHLPGVSAGFYLWVNGKKIGYSEDSRGPAEFDVTDALKPGENLLAAEVYRFTDGAYLEARTSGACRASSATSSSGRRSRSTWRTSGSRPTSTRSTATPP